MPRSIAVLRVDAFTARAFGGNPAGVVLDADLLSEGDMRRIAGEMNLAETAFVCRPTGPGPDLRLRWFTPSGHEIGFCGHATVAAVHSLAEADRLRGDRIVFETLGGLLAVRVERGDGRTMIWLEPGLPSCSPYAGGLDEVLAAMGLARLGSWARPALSGDRDLLLPVPALSSLRRLEPDMGGIAKIAAAGNLRGLCAVALEGVDPGSRTHCRFFAPHVGIPEDLVTGSVHAAIPVWLWESGVVTADGDAVRFTAEQGDGLGRPGRLRVELYIEGGRPARVRVGGEAVTMLTGTLRLG